MATARDPWPFEAFVAWGRYLSWADLHRQRLHRYFEEEGESELPGHTGRFITFVAQWFASLWVVVEGYTDLELQDDVVDSLLRNPPEHSDLLRRCRHGVYHYQPDLLARRLIDFLVSAKSAVAWAHALHFEFIRLFWDGPLRGGLPDGIVDEWRTMVGETLGWRPDGDSAYVVVTNLEARIREYAAAVPDDDMSQEAADVRAAVLQMRQAAGEARANLHKRQQRYRDARWLDAFPGGSDAEL